MVICLERGADLHMAQLMPLPLSVSCFSKIQIGFTFLVPAHPGSPGQRAVKQMCVCVTYLTFARTSMRCMWSLVGLGMCIWSVATLLGRSTGHLKVVHLKGKGRDNSKVSYLSTKLLEISWNLKLLLEILEMSWNLVLMLLENFYN